MACTVTYFSTKKGKEISFTGATKDEVQRKFIRYILREEPEVHSELENILLPRLTNSDLNVVDENNMVDKDALFSFFVNDYLNSMSMMSLLYGDARMMHKDFTDATKRNGNLISAGSQSGSGTTTVAIIKDKPINLAQEDAEHPVRGLISTNNDSAIVEPQDGQSYTSIHWYMDKYLPSLAKYPKKVRDSFIKLRAGIPLTNKEANYLKNNYASFVDRKMVGKSLFNLIKTSTHLQSRDKTSYIDYKGRAKDSVYSELLSLWNKYDSAPNQLEKQAVLSQIHSFYKPQLGYEYHHQMLNDMELSGTHWVAADSASKTTTTDVGRYNEDEGFFELTPHQMPDSGILEQVKTDHIKDEIVHSTQLQGLVWSEQEDTTNLTTPGGVETTVGKLRQAYVEKIAQRTIDGLGKKREELFLPDGQVNYPLIHERISRGMMSSSPDPQLVKLLSLDVTGKPKFNWNLIVLNKKLQNLLLNYLSKDTLKHVVEGYKYTLVSAVGHKVIYEKSSGKIIPKSVYLENPSKYETKDYSTRELRAGLNENGVYVAEAIVPQRVLDKWGIRAGQEITVNGQALYQMGVRIPTQDKHSMVTLKIVDALPSLYENSVILPYEVVFLSGADFDIDSLFARDFYSYKAGKKAFVFGGYKSSDTPVEQAYHEWLHSDEVEKTYRTEIEQSIEQDATLKELNKELADLQLKELEDYNDSPQAFFEDTGRILALEEDLIPERRRELKIAVVEKKTTLEQFSKTHGKKVAANVAAYQKGNLSKVAAITEEENNNLLLEIESSLAFNEGNKNIATTKASLKAFEKAAEQFKAWGIITSDEAIGLYDAFDKALSQQSNDTGKANIGPAALHNIMFQLLADKKAKTTTDGIDPYFGKYTGYESFVNSKGERINDLISTIITGMTDNAKHLLAAKFKLTFDQVGPFMHMVSMGMPFTQALLVIRQPILSIYQELVEDKKRLIKRRGQLEKDLIQGLKMDAITQTAAKKLYEELFADKIEAGEDSDIEELADVISKPQEFVLTDEELAAMDVQYQEGVIDNPEEYFAKQLYLLGQYNRVKEDSKSLINFSTIISLIKGFKTNFAQSRAVDGALGSIGLLPQFKVVAGMKKLTSPVEVVEKEGKLVAYFEDKASPGNPIMEFSLEVAPPEDAPVITEAMRAIVLTNRTLFARVATDQILKRDSAQIVIRQTPAYADMIEEIEASLNQFFLLNKDGAEKIESALITFLNMRAYAQLSKRVADATGKPALNDDKTNAIKLMALFKLMPDGQSVSQYVFNRLKNDPEFKGNKFLNFVRTQDFEITGKYNPMANLIMGKIVGDTRSEYTPEYRQDVANDLIALRRAGQDYPAVLESQEALANLPAALEEMSPKQLAKFAYDLVKDYALLVDNMQYRNNGLAKLVDPIIWKSFADSLTAVQHFMSGHRTPITFLGQELKLRDFTDVFGLTRDELVAEFMQVYSRNVANSGEVRFIKAPSFSAQINKLADGQVIEFHKSGNSVSTLAVNLNRIENKENFGAIVNRLRNFGFFYQGEGLMKVPQVMKVGGSKMPTRLMHIKEAWSREGDKNYYFTRQAVPGKKGDVVLHQVVRYDYRKADGKVRGGPIEGTQVVVRNFPILVSGVSYELSEWIAPTGVVGLALPLAMAEYVAAYTRELTNSPDRGASPAKSSTSGGIDLSDLNLGAINLDEVQSEKDFLQEVYSKHKATVKEGIMLFPNLDFIPTLKEYISRYGDIFTVKKVTSPQGELLGYRIDLKIPNIDDVAKQMEC